MANVSVSSIANDINVSSTLSNISVSDDSGQFLVNVTSTASAITVNPVNTVVEVAASAIVSNQAIRAAIEVANVSGFGNISYDSNIDTSDGIISYVGVSSSDIRSQLSANTSNGITYDDATGIIDQNLNTDLVSEGVSNLYFTNARFDFNFSQKDTDDLSEGTTNLYLNGAGTTDDLAEGSANLWFTNARAVSAITDATIAPGNVTLKEFKETIVDNGAATSGALTLDMSLGSLHLVALNGDITGITLSNMDEGATATIIFEQDVFGGRTIDTTSGFGAWNFMGGVTDLGPIGASRSVLVVTLADSVYQASISSPDAATTDDLAEGSTNLYYTDARSRGALSTTNASASGGGSLAYNSSTGLFTFTPPDLSTAGLTNADVQAFIQENGLDVSANIILNGSQSDNGGQVVFTRDSWGGGYNNAHIIKQGTSSDLKFTSDAGYTFVIDAGDDTTGDSFKVTYNNDNNIPQFEIKEDGNINIDLRATGSSPDTNEFIIERTGVEKLSVNNQGNLTTVGVITAGTNATDTHTFTGNIDVTGNIEVSGNLNYREVEDLLVQDQTITLNYGNASAQDAQIIVDRSGSTLTNVDIKWNETTDKWTFTNDGSTYNNFLTTADIPASAVTSVNGLTGVVVLDTDNIAEGSANLYYTNARADARVNLQTGTNLDLSSKSTSDLSEGTNLYYTDARVDAHLTGGTGIDYTAGTIDLADTAVTPGTYGDASNIPQLVVDQQGRITGVSDVAISIPASYGNVEVADFLANGFGSNTITTTGNISASYFIGDGSLLTNISGANVSTVDQAKTVVKTVIAGEDLAKGDAVYISGGTGDNPEVSKADADDATKMPVFGVTTEAVTATNTTDIVIYGLLQSYNTTGFATGDSLFVSTTPGALTTTKPTGESALLQTVGKVIKGNSSGGKITITGAGRTNATPNLNDGNIFIGNGSNQSVSAVLDTSIVPENTNLYFSNARVDSYIQDGEATLIKTSVDAQPVPLAENGFIARQSSGSTGDSANVYSVPRISTYKAGANTDWSAGTITESAANTLISAFNNDSARYRKLVVAGSTLAEGITNLPATAIVSSIGTPFDANLNLVPGFYTSDASLAPGTISFRTTQESVANSLISSNDFTFYSNMTSTEKSTVAFMDSQFHIGTEEADSSYSFPKTPGITDQILQLDANNDLQFVTKAGLDATGTVTSIDISTGTNLTPTGGPITTSGTINIDMSNALTQMNSITAVTDFDLNVDRNFTVTGNYGVDSVDTDMAKISSDGYAVFPGDQYTTSTRGSYTDTANLVYYEIEGNITAGSNTVNVTAIRDGGTGVTKALTDLNPGYTLSDYIDSAATVQSIDSGAGTITFNANAFETATFDYSANIKLLPAAVDTDTGLVVGLYSEYQVNNDGTGSYNTLDVVNPLNIKYGYPQSGFTNADFNIYSVGNSSVFSFIDDSAFTVARSSVSAANSSLNTATGITIGRNTDLSNRGENDAFPAFGLTQMWDGVEAVSVTTQPHILAKSYAQNTPLNFANTKGSGATRLFFSSADGSINTDPYDTYPRSTQELGRIAWWGTTGTQITPSSYNVPGFISVGAADDWDTWGGSTAGNTNVYMGATSDGLNPDTYLSYKSGELFLGGGNSKSITFAPAHNGSAQSPQNAYEGLVKVWANVNYANVSGSTGSKLSVTNGGAFGAGVVGDMELSIKRVDNTDTTDFVLQDILSSGFLNDWTDSTRIYARISSASGPGNIHGQAITFNNLIASSASGNESALRNQVRYVSWSVDAGIDYYALHDDAGLTTPTTYASIGGTAGANYASQSGVGGGFTAGIVGGVTAREYKFQLDEQSENLKLATVGAPGSAEVDILEVHQGAGNSVISRLELVTNVTSTHKFSGTFNQTGNITVPTTIGNFISYSTSSSVPSDTTTLDCQNFVETSTSSGTNRTEGGGVWVIKYKNQSGNSWTVNTANTTNAPLSDTLSDGSSFVYRITQIEDIVIAEKIL